MKRRIVMESNRAVALAMILVTLLVSCSPELSGPGALSSRMLAERSISMIGNALENEVVINALRDEHNEEIDKLLSGEMSVKETVTRALGESGGREYLEFMVAAGEANSDPESWTTEDVFRAAEGLCDEASLNDARAQVKELEEKLGKQAEEETRALTSSQQKKVYRELRKLVIKAAVLLTAAVVYACVPTMMFWGKVSAASACAIAAGVLAASIMYLIECSKLGGSATTFEEWCEDISKEPAAAWAIASGLISTNIAMGHSPIITAIVIGVFALYGIRDDIMPLLNSAGTRR